MHIPTTTLHEWTWSYKRYSCRAIGDISNDQKKRVIDILTTNMGNPTELALLCNEAIARNLMQEDVMMERVPRIVVVEEAE